MLVQFDGCKMRAARMMGISGRPWDHFGAMVSAKNLDTYRTSTGRREDILFELGGRELMDGEALRFPSTGTDTG